jgi:hypothetical protein
VESSDAPDRAHLVDLVEGNDVDGLVRFVGSLCSTRAWDLLVELRDRCLHAVERGKQLWGVAQYAEYRLALDGPPPYAAGVVVEGAGRFALGPLWEVAASTHPWDDLAPHLAAGRPRALVAHERVVRGEDLTGADVDRRVLEVPLRLQEWEPAYPVAVYRPDKADFPERDLPRPAAAELPAPGRVVDDGVAEDALYALVRPWVEQSNGTAEAVAVEGDAVSAIRAIGPSRARIAPLSFAEALHHMAWTAASGGAYGRRRGTPVGRAAAWWVVAALAGIEDEWPGDPDDLGAAGERLRWFLWDPGAGVGGWACHLAIEDPADGLAWALSAVDAM